MFSTCAVLVLFFTGGLDETLHSIIHMCQERRIPLIFALGRRALGRACAKPVPVSVVGIFSYDGLEVRLFIFIHLYLPEKDMQWLSRKKIFWKFSHEWVSCKKKPWPYHPRFFLNTDVWFLTFWRFEDSSRIWNCVSVCTMPGLIC